MGNLLNKESLLKKEDLKREKVELENGDYVFVCQMTGRARDNFEKSLMKKVKNEGKPTDYETSLDNFRAKLAVATICDEEGNLLLLPTDADKLGESMGAVNLAKIADAASDLNKMSEKDKEDLVKNSEGDLVASSSSASVEN